MPLSHSPWSPLPDFKVIQFVSCTLWRYKIKCFSAGYENKGSLSGPILQGIFNIVQNPLNCNIVHPEGIPWEWNMKVLKLFLMLRTSGSDWQLKVLQLLLYESFKRSTYQAWSRTHTWATRSPASHFQLCWPPPPRPQSSLTQHCTKIMRSTLVVAALSK